ncbi:uncharacterized protein LOC126375665 [Pectinophora gossypiella]|uniref:uncharacterized protein LOC126375665 n=1 Tax=Pectinophora gossypiella TaxID=13191 RepID=UPI00214E38BE|nr:uncharacterized protein LOC126375665 [Pectinophora gossypiella]
MQLLHDHQTLLATVRDINVMSSAMATKDATSDSFEVKEKRSSDASLLLMNPVASGDNVATGLNSTHKLKDELPSLVPCCEGRELQINEELVRTGLSAISVKHDNSVIQCLSMSRACEKMQVQPGLVKHRNSFRSLHRPDLKRVPYLRRMTPDELETLFRGYADIPGCRSNKNENRDEARNTPEENHRSREPKKEAIGPDDGNTAIALHPIPETRSGAEDVPAGMRLHGARARLYTSVLAGAKAGDQLDSIQTNEEYDHRVPDEPLPEDEVQLNEELQIILPPRCDDVTAESSTTTTTTNNTDISIS